MNYQSPSRLLSSKIIAYRHRRKENKLERPRKRVRTRWEQQERNENIAVATVAIVLAIVILILVGLIVDLAVTDQNTNQGPIVQRNVASHITKIYDGNSGDPLIFLQYTGGTVVAVDIINGPDVGLFNVGDQVLMNLNKDTKVLTFEDISTHTKVCASDSDCDW